MDGFKRRTEQKMTGIRNAALALFTQYGMQKVSIAEIARHAGVSPATIFNYFGSKEQLLIHLLQHEMDKQIQAYEDMLNRPLRFTEKTELIMLGEAKMLRMFAEIGIFDSGSSSHTAMMAFLKAYEAETFTPFLMKYIRHGRQEGCIAGHLTDDMILQYLDMYSQYVMKQMLQGRYTGTPEENRQLLHLFFYGLTGVEPELN